MASTAPPRQSVKARLSLGSSASNGARVNANTLQRYRSGGGGGGGGGSYAGSGFVGSGVYRAASRRGASRMRGGGRVGQIGRPLVQSFGASPRGRGGQWSVNNGTAAVVTPLQNRLGTTRGGRASRRARAANRSVNEDNGGYRRGRGSFRSPQLRGRAQGNRFRNANQTRGGGTNVRRGGARARGRGRGRGRGSRGQPATTSRQTLDNQLDEYMSRTKGHLDMELDSYMAQSHAE